MKRLLFVFNPHSGTGKICKRLAIVLDIFTKSGYEVVVYPTQSAGDGERKIMEEGKNYERIVVAGGDGMLHELVNAALQLPEDVSVGYIPAGTVNDFAATHNIPRNIDEAAKVAVEDSCAAIDVGKFQEELFSYVAAFGVATNVAYDTDQNAKNRWGVLAYVGNVLKNMEYSKFCEACHHVKIVTDNTVLEDEFMFGAVSNSFYIAGMKNYMSGGIELDDGLLEGIFVRKPKTIMEFEQLKKALIKRDFDTPCICIMKAENFEVSSESMKWTLDGEDGGEHEKVTISVVKQALRITLPQKDKCQIG